jgi:hypothetical protein
MAGRHTLTQLTTDPVVSGAKMVRMSSAVGVLGPDAWCQGPEKTCYIASSDGVYLIQPNQFNIQRGQSVTVARLDGFFSSVNVNPDETDIHLEYDPPRGVVFMFVNRTADPSNTVHYQFHISTQSWWTFKIADARMDVIRAACLYTPMSGDREGLWFGCKSGRICVQPASGILTHDGGVHTSPLRASGDNDPEAGNEAGFTSRLAWSPINAGLTNERLLLTELNVLLDQHDFPETDGITKSGPTLTLYGADTAQILSGISGDIGVTESRLVIDGNATTAAIDCNVIANFGANNRYAQATITVTVQTDIDTNDKIFLRATDAPSVEIQFICVASSPSLGVSFLSATSNNVTATNIAACINGHAKFTASANGSVIAINQVTIGRGTDTGDGNTVVRFGEAGSTEVGWTKTNFAGGGAHPPSLGYARQAEVIIQLHHSVLTDLNAKTLIFNDLSSSTSEVTLIFDNTIFPDASTATKIGIAGLEGNRLGIMRVIKKVIDINYDEGLLNIKASDAVNGDPALMTLRLTDAWDGTTAMPAIAGTATTTVHTGSTYYVHNVLFTITTGGWHQFITGGGASRCGGTSADPTSESTYTLDDVAADNPLRKWSKGNEYTVRKSGNTTATDPPQFDGIWGIMPKTESTIGPLYMASNPTISLALSSMTSTEILPSAYTSTASTAIVDPLQDTEILKRELQTWSLVKGRNNRLRVRKRESDFQIQISASGTVWVLEDIAVNIEQGGKYRSVIAS